MNILSMQTLPYFCKICLKVFSCTFIYKSSCPKLFENSQNLQENTCIRVSSLIKLLARSLQLLLKKRLWHRCFPVNFTKFLGTPFYRTLRATASVFFIPMSKLLWCNKSPHHTIQLVQFFLHLHSIPHPDTPYIQLIVSHLSHFQNSLLGKE